MNTEEQHESTTIQPQHGTAAHYQFSVEGRLSPRWAALFDGLEVSDGPAGTTLIAGSIQDQAALHAVLRRFRDLGLNLISLSRTASR